MGIRVNTIQYANDNFAKDAWTPRKRNNRACNYSWEGGYIYIRIIMYRETMRRMQRPGAPYTTQKFQ